MTPFFSKLIFLLLAIGWYCIRYKYARRASRTPVLLSARGARETVLLLISLCGLGLVPLLYIASDMPRFANYKLKPGLAWFGLLCAIVSLSMFHLTHRALGRNWSVSLDVRLDHKLITSGIYEHIRHPMYSAFWLWALAQAMLLPNWVAGFSGLVGFGILFFGRVSREEQIMTDIFGDNYREYMERTSRVFPKIYW